MEQSTNAPLLDVPQVAARLGVTQEYVRRLMRNKMLPSTKIGRLWRMRPDALDAWIEQRSNT